MYDWDDTFVYGILGGIALIIVIIVLYFNLPA